MAGREIETQSPLNDETKYIWLRGKHERRERERESAAGCIVIESATSKFSRQHVVWKSSSYVQIAKDLHLLRSLIRRPRILYNQGFPREVA